LTKTKDRNGTQAIGRAVALLREISARGPMGVRLSDLAAECDLTNSTAHRILVCLKEEGLVRQRPGNKRYVPGVTLFELGLSLSERGDLQHAARSRLAALARNTRGIGFLFFRSGDDFVCAARVGDAELKLPVHTGARWPLVLSAGGVAMLLPLSEAEASATIDRNFARLSGFGKSRAGGIRRMLQRSFDHGFGVCAGDILTGVNAFGMPLCDAAGIPFAAIALAGSERAFPMERSGEVRGLLRGVAEGLSAAAS
jgi:DNA-binding IclR family transcriptional regulator